MRLSFGAGTVADMFQRKINEIYKDMPNAFCFAHAILAVSYGKGGLDHDTSKHRVLQICRRENEEF